jgi:hypothetical protein
VGVGEAYTEKCSTLFCDHAAYLYLRNENDKLWHNKLKCLVRDRYWPSLTDSSFRCSKQKLREVGIITFERIPSKKKAPIRLSKAARERYLFGNLQIPDTYLPRKQASDRELNTLHRLRKSGQRKDIRESEGARRQRIVQYILIRALYGATFPRRVTDELEQCLPGLIWTCVDKNGHSYSYEDIEYTLTEEQKEALNPVILDTVTFPGYSVMDLVKKRDIGSSRFFQYVNANTSEEECEAIVQDLIDKKILVRMTNDEIYDAIVNIKHSEVYPFLLAEPRYKIASQPLSNYVEAWNTLQYFVTKRIEVTWLMGPSRLQKEIDLFQYYSGFKIMNDFRTRQKLVHQKISMVENNDRRHEPDKKLLEGYREERSVWDENIRTKLKEIREKQEYVEIRKEFPALHELFMTPLKNCSSILGLSERDLDW